MSDERLDLLAESARNRGLKLVRSRVRTPGKRRFGKVGLTDKSGKAVFGMDDKGPTAKPEEVEQYLRNLGAKDWGASLGVAVMPRKRKAPPKKAAQSSADASRSQTTPEAAPSRRHRPQPTSAEAQAESARSEAGRRRALAKLIRLLEHKIDEKGVRKRISALAKADELPPLVATLDKKVIGLCGIDRMVDHPPRQAGRPHHDAHRRRGLRGVRASARMLMEAAEQRLRKRGCGLHRDHQRTIGLTAAHGFLSAPGLRARPASASQRRSR